MTRQARRVLIFGEYRAEVGMAIERNASWMGQKRRWGDSAHRRAEPYKSAD